MDTLTQNQWLLRSQQFWLLTKPRVVSLIVFTAVIGMFLATPGMVPIRILLAATIGIALVAGAAAARQGSGAGARHERIELLLNQTIDRGSGAGN